MSWLIPQETATALAAVTTSSASAVPPPPPPVPQSAANPAQAPAPGPAAAADDPMEINDSTEDSASSDDSDVEFDTTPSTSVQQSSLGEIALLSSRKRAKITRSCDQCRKLPCTGFKPCFRCTQNGLVCTYGRRYTRGVSPQPPPQPPGANRTERHYGPKKRLSRRRQREPEACDHCRVHKIPCVGKLPRFRILSHPTDGKPGVQSLPSTAPERRVPEIEPLQYPNRHSDEEIPPLIFLHRAWRRIAVAQNLGFRSTPDDFRGPGQLILASGDLPLSAAHHTLFPHKLEMWHMLQDRFWSGWTETFHFIHRLTAKAWLDTVYRNWSAQQPLETGISHAKATVALMTMALGSMFYHESVLPTREELSWKWLWTISNGDQIFRMTIRLTDNEPGPPVLESVQARLLQAMYLLSTCRISHACYVFGNAVSMLTAIGLHRQRGRNRGLGPEIVLSPEYAKVECEKRTFWSAFIIDRQLSMIMGRPPYFTSDTVSQVLPDPINDEDMGRAGPFRPHKEDCYVEALVEQVKLIKIIEKIQTQVYTLDDKSEDDRLARAVQLGEALEECKQGWPFLMSKVKPSMLQIGYRRQHTMLRLAYWHAQILAYRPFLTAPYPNDPETRRTADMAIYTCLEAARAALSTSLRLARVQAESDNSHFHTLLYLHHITFVAAAAVYVAPHIRERQKLLGGDQPSLFRHSDESMAYLYALAQDATKALVQGTNSYSPARLWAVILKELRQEAAAQIPQNLETSNADCSNTNNAANNETSNNQTAPSIAAGPQQQQPQQQQEQEQQQPQQQVQQSQQDQQQATENRDEPDSASINEQLLEDALRAHWDASINIQTTTTQEPATTTSGTASTSRGRSPGNTTAIPSSAAGAGAAGHCPEVVG
ncbi:hypothetical protein VTJ49DRAFT_2228 [Mycothermus thermophilus]|uniref:Zn(2)-C6 fungal-type domain-containing protein n=1 Tax=Humicola insolens TaxID=85995 RepID=A0ABR3VBJ6_HUMIN